MQDDDLLEITGNPFWTPITLSRSRGTVERRFLGAQPLCDLSDITAVEVRPAARSGDKQHELALKVKSGADIVLRQSTDRVRCKLDAHRIERMLGLMPAGTETGMRSALWDIEPRVSEFALRDMPELTIENKPTHCEITAALSKEALAQQCSGWLSLAVIGVIMLGFWFLMGYYDVLAPSLATYVIPVVVVALFATSWNKIRRIRAQHITVALDPNWMRIFTKTTVVEVPLRSIEAIRAGNNGQGQPCVALQCEGHCYEIGELSSAGCANLAQALLRLGYDLVHTGSRTTIPA